MRLSRGARSLEDRFFFNEDKKLREKQALLERMKETKEALREASGITDDAVLQKLVELNVRPDTLTSLSLVPLIEIAWADGKVAREEKEAILFAVEKFGWAKESIDYAVLERWLDRRPDEGLLDAWVQYIKNICAKMTAEEVAHFKNEIMDHAIAVARAHGGFLGIGSISEQERKMLAVLESAFSREYHDQHTV
jgi:hypothetical protein